MPRPVSTKTPLGVLRSLLEISAADMAKRVGVGTSTLQAIEQGKFAVSEPIARKLAHAYFVDPEWLMNGNAADGVRGFNGHAWTKADIVRYRMRLGAQMDGATREIATQSAQRMVNNFATLFAEALKDGKIWQVVIDADVAFKEILKTYYPAEYAKLPTTTTPHSKGKQPSRPALASPKTTALPG